MVGSPKTKSSRRVISLSQSVIDRLHELRENGAGGFIFKTSTGRPVSPRNVVHDFKKALAGSGLPDIPFHGLRHTTATILLQQRTHPKIVQELLGHASIVQTLDTYSHVIGGMDGEVAEKMDEIFG